jgi:hypothetical protein
MAFEFAYFEPFDLVFELPPYSLFLSRAFERKSRDGIGIKSISGAILGHLNAFPFSEKVREICVFARTTTQFLSFCPL